LLGPNGAGKTTTFYMVVGIVPRDAGNIIIDDEDISLLPLHARAGASAICRRKPRFSVA
jgi:lipopolysaccharide export system ATP-binding protein